MAPHPPMHRCQKRRKRAAVRTYSSEFAGTRERAGTRRGPVSTSARGLHVMEIRFVPQMIAEATMPHILFIPKGEAGMTACLIVLALAGLVAIAVWEGFQ